MKSQARRMRGEPETEREPRIAAAAGGTCAGLRTALICMAIFAVAAGCKSERPPPPSDPGPAGGSPQAAEPAVDARGRSTKHFTKDEVYGDRDTFDGPRLQFVWGAPGEPKESIWSMKVDGSDMRRAAGPELLYSGEAKFLAPLTPVRSPDGRYIACVGSANGDDLRFLVDLEEKKVRTMMKGGGVVHFAWTPDSKQVVFYTDLELYQYTVESGKLEKLPMIYSKGFQIVDGGKRVVAVRDDAIEYLDRRGKLVKRVALPTRFQSNPDIGGTGADNFISPDGRTFALAVDGNSRRVVVSIDNLEKPLYEDDHWYFRSAFGPHGKTLYHFNGDKVMVLDLASGRSSQIAEIPGELAAHELTAFHVRRPR